MPHVFLIARSGPCTSGDFQTFMMHQVTPRILIFCFLFLTTTGGLFAGRGERPGIDLDALSPDDYLHGRLYLKLDRELAPKSPGLSLPHGPDGLPLTGIPGLDSLSARLGVREARSLLQALYLSSAKSVEFIERHEKWGFHLWHEFLLPDSAQIVDAVRGYEMIEGVHRVEPVYVIEAINAIGPGASSAGSGRGGLPDAGGRAAGPDREVWSQAPPSPGECLETARSWTPGDPLFVDQWHYHNTGQSGGSPGADISLPDAWEIEKGSPGVVVAIIDSGMQHDHPDLVSNTWSGLGYNFVLLQEGINPGSHGTHVAGTVAAVSNNGIGVAGVAGGDGSGNGVRLMSLQVFGPGDDQGGFHLAPIYAADQGAAISQNSWGYRSANVYNSFVLDAIDYFNLYGGGSVMQGGLSVFSAGNQNESLERYPAFYGGSLAVASTDRNDQRSAFSNYGHWIDISAPGSEVLSTDVTSKYSVKSGTSMASPHVSGVAALVLSLAPNHFTADQLRHILTHTADDHYDVNPGFGGMLGSGRLNAQAALLYAQQLMNGPALFTARATGPEQVYLSWKLNGQGHGVLLAHAGDDGFGEPQDGQAYDPGDPIPGGGQVVYAGTATHTMHESLDPDSPYHYRIWSRDEHGSYSAGVDAFARTLCNPFPLPYYEDFEGKDEQFNCWRSMRNTPAEGGLNGGGLDLLGEATHGWRVNKAATDNAFGPGHHYIRSGTRSARASHAVGLDVGPITWDSGYQWLVSPILELPEEGDLELRYWKAFLATEEYQTSFHVLVHHQDQWIGVASKTYEPPDGHENWFARELSHSLNDFRGHPVRIAFVYEETEGWDLAVDDVRVSKSSRTVQAGAWTDVLTWGGGMPGNGSMAVVGHQVQLDSDAEVFGLSIESGEAGTRESPGLLIGPGGKLSVSTFVSNEAGSHALVLSADEQGQASLLHFGDGFPASIDYYYHGAKLAWQGLASPFSHLVVTATFEAVEMLYAWHEGTQAWVGWQDTGHWPDWSDANPGSHWLNPGQGYLWAWDHDDAQAPIRRFAGILNGNAQLVSLSVASHPEDQYRGFNLLGNPFAASLDWDHPTGWAGRDGLLKTVEGKGPSPGWQYWMLNPVSGNYGTYVSGLPGGHGSLGLGRHIPPMHAFWVEARDPGEITIGPELQSHAQHQWEDEPKHLSGPAEGVGVLARRDRGLTSYGDSGSTVQPDPAGVAGNSFRSAEGGTMPGEERLGLHLRLEREAGGHHDEVLLLLGHGQSFGGAGKMHSPLAMAPGLWIWAGASEYSIAWYGMPPEEGVALGFSAGEDALYRLRLHKVHLIDGNHGKGQEGEYLPGRLEMWLEDMHLGLWHRLDKGGDYLFWASDGIENQRFKLHFLASGQSTLVRDARQEGHAALVRLHDGKLHAWNPWPVQAELSLFNMQGIRLLHEGLMPESAITLPFYGPAAAYVVRMKSGSHQYVDKLLYVK